MKHLISLDDLSAAEICGLLSTADHMAEVLARPQPKVPALRTKTVCSLFFEDSTRTRLSFETAAKRLSAETLTFTASSCSRYPWLFQPLERAADVDADFHVLLGDTSYNDGARTLEEFRARWRSTLSTPEYRALLTSTGVVATWAWLLVDATARG